MVRYHLERENSQQQQQQQQKNYFIDTIITIVDSYLKSSFVYLV